MMGSSRNTFVHSLGRGQLLRQGLEDCDEPGVLGLVEAEVAEGVKERTIEKLSFALGHRTP